MTNFASTYIGRLRSRIGHDLVISPGVQVLVFEPSGLLLIQQRADSSVWEVPAGACEPEQSFMDAALAGVREEVGLELAREKLVAFGTLSAPHAHLLKYPNGDLVRAYALLFKASIESIPDSWTSDGEVTNVEWVDPNCLPDDRVYHRPTLDTVAKYLRYLETGEFQAD